MTNVITFAHDAVPPREPFSQHAESSRNGEIQTDAIGYPRTEPLVRRLRVVWSDLGLDGVVPKDWVEATSTGLSFEELTHRQADLLTVALENIASDFEPEVPQPGIGQLSLFEDGLQ